MIDVFELWCWRRLLRVPWTGRRSNQSILKQMSPECSLEGRMLKLKLQYFGHPMWRTDSFEKTLMLERLKAGTERDDTGWDVGWHHWLNRHELDKLWELVMDREAWRLQSMGLQSFRHDWATELIWTEHRSFDLPCQPHLCMCCFYKHVLLILTQSLHACVYQLVCRLP